MATGREASAANLHEMLCASCCATLNVCPPQGDGLNILLSEGAEKGSWSKDFAAKHKFTADPVIPVPDVSQVDFDEQDEFLVIATDGLWDCMPPVEAIRFARWVLGVIHWAGLRHVNISGGPSAYLEPGLQPSPWSLCTAACSSMHLAAVSALVHGMLQCTLQFVEERGGG